MNEYKIFYNLKNSPSKIVNILVGFLIVLGGLSLVLFIDLPIIFNMITLISLIIFIINSLLERKSILKEKNKIFLDKPIIFDNDNNMYILIDKTGNLLLLVAALLIIISILLKLRKDTLYYFILWCLLTITELGKCLKNANLEHLKKNPNNLYNLINKGNSKYKVLKINSVSKNEDSSYIMEFSNGLSKQLYIVKNYKNYDELIELINKKVKSDKNEL